MMTNKSNINVVLISWRALTALRDSSDISKLPEPSRKYLIDACKSLTFLVLDALHCSDIFLTDFHSK